jgi:hypothetical protein
MFKCYLDDDGYDAICYVNENPIKVSMLLNVVGYDAIYYVNDNSMNG